MENTNPCTVDVAQLATALRQLMRTGLPKGAMCHYQLRPDHVYLDKLRFPQPHGQGRGTTFLAQFLSCADAVGQEVRLRADPTDDPGDAQLPDLVRWYRRWGFEPYRADDNGVWMRRAPLPSVPVADQISRYQAARVHDWTPDEWMVWWAQARHRSGCSMVPPHRWRRR